MRTLILSAAFTTLSLPVSANEFAPAMQSFLESEIMDWASDPILLEAIRTQNVRTGDYSAEDIEAMDLAWRAEVGTTTTPTITPVLQSPAAEFLRQRVMDAGGTITEIFVMDARGLNVAASDVTSDYWQGDEAKFSETYPRGAGAHHFGEVEFDESSQSYQSQISLAITDPDTQEVIGAMTVGVDAEALF